MDANDIDAALERLAELEGGRYDPTEFWDWYDIVLDEAYNQGLRD